MYLLIVLKITISNDIHKIFQAIILNNLKSLKFKLFYEHANSRPDIILN